MKICVYEGKDERSSIRQKSSYVAHNMDQTSHATREVFDQIPDTDISCLHDFFVCVSRSGNVISRWAKRYYRSISL